MIDIHNHILFDIDDGAKTIEASVQMCRDAYKNGIEHIVLTPHFVKFSDIESFVEERDNKIFDNTKFLSIFFREHIKKLAYWIFMQKGLRGGYPHATNDQESADPPKIFF